MSEEEDKLGNFIRNNKKKIFYFLVFILLIFATLSLWQPYVGKAVKNDPTSRGAYQGVCYFLTLHFWEAEFLRKDYAISKSKKLYAMGSTIKETKKDMKCNSNLWSHKN